MTRAIVLFLTVSLGAATLIAIETPVHSITTGQARALVMASLNADQTQLPKLEAIQYHAPGPPKYLFFTITWEGTLGGSVVVGNYAVDPHTGDVFSATIACHEEKNKSLQALQAQIRAALRLSDSDYQRLKTKGPLCEQ